MRISDWSADVCSSDLVEQARDLLLAFQLVEQLADALQIGRRVAFHQVRLAAHDQHGALSSLARPGGAAARDQFRRDAVRRRLSCGRASGREIDGSEVMILVLPLSVKKKKSTTN